jgi:hypothetical protein
VTEEKTMTSMKALLMSLSAAAFVMLGGCGQDAGDTSGQTDDSAMSDTAPGTPSEPGEAGETGTMGGEAGDTYGTGDPATAPGGATDPSMTDPSMTEPSTDPNATGTEPGTTPPEGTSTPNQ